MSDQEINIEGAEQNSPGSQENLPNATAIIVLGILSIPSGCCLYGVPGLILAGIALFLASKSNNIYLQAPESYTESSLKNINLGKIFAWIGIALSIITLAIGIYMVSTGQYQEMMQEWERMMEQDEF